MNRTHLCTCEYEIEVAFSSRRQKTFARSLALGNRRCATLIYCALKWRTSVASVPDGVVYFSSQVQKMCAPMFEWKYTFNINILFCGITSTINALNISRVTWRKFHILVVRP